MRVSLKWVCSSISEERTDKPLSRIEIMRSGAAGEWQMRYARHALWRGCELRSRRTLTGLNAAVVFDGGAAPNAATMATITAPVVFFGGALDDRAVAMVEPTTAGYVPFGSLEITPLPTRRRGQSPTGF